MASSTRARAAASPSRSVAANPHAPRWSTRSPIPRSADRSMPSTAPSLTLTPSCSRSTWRASAYEAPRRDAAWTIAPRSCRSAPTARPPIDHYEESERGRGHERAELLAVPRGRRQVQEPRQRADHDREREDARRAYAWDVHEASQDDRRDQREGQV